MQDPGPLCLDCADLGHLEFLPSGDAAMTRRAKKASGLSAVVVRWSRSRKRYERQGILAETEAIEFAEQECLADAELRARRRERDEARRADEDERFQAELADAAHTVSRLRHRSSQFDCATCRYAGKLPDWTQRGRAGTRSRRRATRGRRLGPAR
jgi:hypothetical protein